MADDVGYYERRLQQEREAAASTDNDQNRQIHLELAELYAKMLGVLRTANDQA